MRVIANTPYAPEQLIQTPYTITFDPSVQKVFLRGDNNDIVDKFNFNGVSVIPSNSAGNTVTETGVSGLTGEESDTLISLKQTLYPSATIYIDTVNGSATVADGVGSPGNEAGNWSVASTVATALSYNRFNLAETLSLGPSDVYDNTRWAGSGGTADTLVFGGASSAGVSARDLIIAGALNGRVLFRECSIQSITGFDGSIANCTLTGPIVVDSSAALPQIIAASTSLVAGTGRPVWNHNDSVADLNVREYFGGLTLEGLTQGNNVSVDFTTGTLEIGASCTDCTIVVGGMTKIINNAIANPNVTIVDDRTAQALVWSQELPL